MAVRTKDEVVISTNGNGKAPEQLAPTAIKLSGFQQKYMKRLIDNFERAKASVDAAQNAANEFIAACGEEARVQVGVGGWTFDIEALEFVKVPQMGEEGIDGNNRRSE